MRMCTPLPIAFSAYLFLKLPIIHAYSINSLVCLGWVFAQSEFHGATPDPLHGCKSIRELYLVGNPEHTGKVSTKELA